MRILLAGQPNCGKTTLFNALTGRRAPTGNRPGVTVEAVRGIIRGTEDMLMDLPGLYALSGEVRTRRWPGSNWKRMLRI